MRPRKARASAASKLPIVEPGKNTMRRAGVRAGSGATISWLKSAHTACTSRPG